MSEQPTTSHTRRSTEEICAARDGANQTRAATETAAAQTEYNRYKDQKLSVAALAEHVVAQELSRPAAICLVVGMFRDPATVQRAIGRVPRWMDAEQRLREAIAAAEALIGPPTEVAALQKEERRELTRIRDLLLARAKAYTKKLESYVVDH
ncbi:hypothetical protein L0F63_002557 [Massospora cicadina]|nr:hypothetical protein L0F63_002557 [Massospora cicadina]